MRGVSRWSERLPYITVGIYSQHIYTHITYERDEGQDPESKSRVKEAQGKVEGAREILPGLSDRKRRERGEEGLHSMDLWSNCQRSSL